MSFFRSKSSKSLKIMQTNKDQSNSTIQQEKNQLFSQTIESGQLNHEQVIFDERSGDIFDIWNLSVSQQRLFDFEDEIQQDGQLINIIQIFWVDEEINKEENILMIKQIQKFFASVRSFTNITNCEEQIKQLNSYDSQIIENPQLQTRKIFLIFSGAHIQDTAFQLVQKYSNIIKVFILAQNVDNLNFVKPSNEKIKLITNKFNEMLKSIIQEYKISQYIDLKAKSAIHINDSRFFIKFIFLELIIKLGEKKHINFNQAFKDLKEFSIKFIESQNYDPQEKEKQLSVRLLYIRSLRPETLQDTKPINWFTKDCFIFKMINNTIRSGNLLDYFSIRLAIYRLYEDLKKRQKQEKPHFSQKLYRGTFIYQDELKRWENTKYPLVMFGFNSLTQKKQQVEEFMQHNFDPNLINVIIEIQSNLSTKNKPVSVQKFKDATSEEEYLLQMNSCLVIKSVEVDQSTIRLQTTIHPFNELIQIQSKNLFSIYNRVMNYTDDDSDDLIFAGALYQAGFHQEVIELLGKTIKKTEDETQYLADIKIQLGASQSALGLYDQSIINYQQALQIYHLVIGEYNQKTANTYYYLGNIQAFKGNHLAATNLHNQALEILIKIKGEKHLSIAMFFGLIGKVYNFLRNYELAVNYYKKELELLLIINGTNYLRIANSYEKIGEVLTASLNFVEAINFYNKAIINLTNINGNNHYQNSRNYNRIAQLFVQLKDYPKAIIFFNKALEILNQNNKEEETGDTYNNIGNTYALNNEYEEAINNHKKALEIRKKILGPKHANVANSLTNIAIIYTRLEKYQEALTHFIKSILIQKAISGFNQIQTANSYDTMGIIYSALKNYHQSINYFKKGLEIKIKMHHFKQQSMAISQSYKYLAEAYQNLQNFDDSIIYLHKLETLQKEEFGDNSLVISDLYKKIGLAYEQSTNYNIALKYFQQCYDLYSKLLGFNNSKTILCEQLIKKMEFLTKFQNDKSG